MPPEARLAPPWLGSLTHQDIAYERQCAQLRRDAAAAARHLGLTPNEELWSCPLNQAHPDSLDARSSDQRTQLPVEQNYDLICEKWMAKQELGHELQRSCLLCGAPLVRAGSTTASNAAAEAKEVKLLPGGHSSLCETCWEGRGHDERFHFDQTHVLRCNKSCPLCEKPVDAVVEAAEAQPLDGATVVQALRIVPVSLWSDKTLVQPTLAAAEPHQHSATRESEGRTLILTVRDILGSEITVSGIGLSSTIRTMKEKIEQQMGIAPDEQLLVVGEPPNQQSLEVETQTLEEYGVHNHLQVLLLMQNPADAVARRAQRAVSLGLQPKVAMQEDTTFDRATLLRVAAEEIQRGPECAVDPTRLSDCLIEYAPLLDKLLLAGEEELCNWRAEKGKALRVFLGAALVDRTGMIDFGLKLHSLYPIPQRDAGFSLSFREVMLRRAAQIMRDNETGVVDVLWSGGIDTTAAGEPPCVHSIHCDALD